MEKIPIKFTENSDSMPIYDLCVNCNNLFRALHIILRTLQIKKQLSKRHIFSGELELEGGRVGERGGWGVRGRDW